MYIDRIILILIALCMVIGVIQGMVIAKTVLDNQDLILQNQTILKKNNSDNPTYEGFN